MKKTYFFNHSRLASSGTLLITLSMAPAAQARVAMFAQELKDRATHDYEATKFLQTEVLETARARPIWLHAGDSLASAWSSGTTMRERLAFAEERELPEAGSLLKDLLFQFPSTEDSWYAGRRLDFGLLGWLSRSTQKEWVIDSTSVAGDKFTSANPQFGQVDNIVHAQVPHDRVRLVSFSLGANDVCRAIAPGNPQDIRNKLKKIKESFRPDTVFAVWDVPDVLAIRKTIFNRLEALPDTVGKGRLLRYCHQNWDKNNCDAAVTKKAETLNQIREDIRQAYKDVFGQVIETDPAVVATNLDVLDLMAGDCFHPSRTAQPLIIKQMAQALEPQLKVLAENLTPSPLPMPPQESQPTPTASQPASPNPVN